MNLSLEWMGLNNASNLNSRNSTVSAAKIAALLWLVGQSAVFAQAPNLLWETNVAARVFAIDNQTNVYASASNLVIKLSPAGSVLQTLTLTNRPGIAQRDASGNYYFAATYPGSFNGSGYDYSTNSSCFLAIYDSAGQLTRTLDFGPTGFLRKIAINDVQVDSAGNCYIAYTYNVATYDHTDGAVKVDSSGLIVWSINLPKHYNPFTTTVGTAHFGPVTPTNAYALAISSDGYGTYAYVSSIDQTGGVAQVSDALCFADSGTDHPVGGPGGIFYSFDDTSLTKRSSDASIIWSVDLGTRTKGTICADGLGGVIIMDNGGAVQRYDSAGDLRWTTNYASLLNGMVIDSAGNRFLSMNDGRVARLANELVAPPVITNAPQGKTVLSGTSTALSVGVSGSSPIYYQWLRNSNSVSGGTNATLNLPNANSYSAGYYSVIASNFVNSVTSSPVQLRVKSVAILGNGQLLTNGTYTYASAPTVSIQSAFTNGSFFYTTDGSTPDFNSTPYNGAFTLQNNTTIRAIGYSADFQASEEADAVNFVILINHHLTTSTSGGGTITLNPPGGTYVSTNIVNVTANSSAGYVFLYWLGDAAGTNPSVNISMTQDRFVSAVFGTTLSTTVAGGGQVTPSGGVFPVGSVIRLSAMPNPGSYFGAWGNAASGNTNPLYYAIAAANPTVSSVFGTIGADQAALTIEISGGGKVLVNPRANVYQTNQTVSLTAVPDDGGIFLGWGGAASGSQNPLSVAMTQSKIVVANFSTSGSLRVSATGVEGLTSSGFRMTLMSEPNLKWNIFGATNLSNWDLIGAVTNESGQVQFTDPGALGMPRRFYRAQLAQ